MCRTGCIDSAARAIAACESGSRRAQARRWSVRRQFLVREKHAARVSDRDAGPSWLIPKKKSRLFAQAAKSREETPERATSISIASSDSWISGNHRRLHEISNQTPSSADGFHEI